MEVLVLRILLASVILALLWPKIKAVSMAFFDKATGMFERRSSPAVVPLDDVAISLEVIRIDLKAIQEQLSSADNAELQQVYVQSLAGITKGLDTLLDRQSKLEQMLVTLISTLNKLTS